MYGGNKVKNYLWSNKVHDPQDSQYIPRKQRGCVLIYFDDCRAVTALLENLMYSSTSMVSSRSLLKILVPIIFLVKEDMGQFIRSVHLKHTWI
jgi:hypothetical protein